MNDTTVVLAAEGLGKQVSSPEGTLAILADVSLSIRRGESVAIIGASGAGKSTLLHVLGLLDPPDQGQVLFDGRPVQDLPVRWLFSSQGPWSLVPGYQPTAIAALADADLISTPWFDRAGVATAAFVMRGGNPDIDTPPPQLGEHTDQILASLGYSAADIQTLRSTEAV